jgi:hypothetical protein
MVYSAHSLDLGPNGRLHQHAGAKERIPTRASIRCIGDPKRPTFKSLWRGLPPSAPRSWMW